MKGLHNVMGINGVVTLFFVFGSLTSLPMTKSISQNKTNEYKIRNQNVKK